MTYKASYKPDAKSPLHETPAHGNTITEAAETFQKWRLENNVTTYHTLVLSCE